MSGENVLATGVLVKVNLFNNYFSQHWKTVYNDRSISLNITFATVQKLSTFEFCTDDIVKIIKSLYPNKAHGHDEIAIQTIKLCASSIASSKPLSILLRKYFQNESFPKEWKKGNIAPVYKKMISNWSKITSQHHYHLFAVKHLKKWTLTRFLNT